ncbi:hypothetical protein [Actinomycetospora flava]|uniref:DUF2516 family protein n=1 Tax=Actinomycetospora flava TaxID=3129232 RepID=A0ABU8M5D7_9PSEU
MGSFAAGVLTYFCAGVIILAFFAVLRWIGTRLHLPSARKYWWIAALALIGSVIAQLGGAQAIGWALLGVLGIFALWFFATEHIGSKDIDSDAFTNTDGNDST